MSWFCRTAMARWPPAGRAWPSTTAMSWRSTPTANPGSCSRSVGAAGWRPARRRSSCCWRVRPTGTARPTRTWGLYAGVAAVAGVREPAGVDHPDVTSGTLGGPDGGLVSLTNHGPTPVRATVHLPGGASAIRRFGPDGAVPLAAEPAPAGTPEPVGASVEVRIEVDLVAHGSTVIGWRAER